MAANYNKSKTAKVVLRGNRYNHFARSTQITKSTIRNYLKMQTRRQIIANKKKNNNILQNTTIECKCMHYIQCKIIQMKPLQNLGKI